MYVYRVEHHTERYGPYSAGLTSDKHYWADTHPNPFDEGLDFRYGDHCGFESKQKLLQWFDLGDLKLFQKFGLYVYKIHVEWIEKGDKQIIFDPNKQYYRKRISLKSLRQYSRRISPFEDDGGQEEWQIGGMKSELPCTSLGSIHGCSIMLL